MTCQISIIMPAYNCSEFIAESIDSVLAQSVTDWELIIVDDCSTDDTCAIVKSYMTDSRIKLLINDVNLGAAKTRNKAFDFASGRFLAFLDGDDLWTPDKLEYQINFMLKHNIGFSFSGYTRMSEQGEISGDIRVPVKVSFTQMLSHNYIACLTGVYDTQCFGKFSTPLLRKRQDYALWLELLKKFDYAYGIPKVLGFYRIRPGTLSTSSKNDAFKYYWHILRTIGDCNVFSAAWHISWYLFIVFLKKKQTGLYHKLFVN
jgi:teichuronic acid biosynthesis glycosyltransferase TuaG